jgi:alpha-glucoside transport system substrate-binding protein
VRRAGSFISGQKQTDTSEPSSEPARLAELLAGSPTVKFDASDAMPAAVGTTPYWSAITRWISGSLTYSELAADLDRRRAEATTPTSS